eukprot:1109091-Rhodomonas_salina.1
MFWAIEGHAAVAIAQQVVRLVQPSTHAEPQPQPPQTEPTRAHNSMARRASQQHREPVMQVLVASGHARQPHQHAQTHGITSFATEPHAIGRNKNTLPTAQDMNRSATWSQQVRRKGWGSGAGWRSSGTWMPCTSPPSAAHTVTPRTLTF